MKLMKFLNAFHHGVVFSKNTSETPEKVKVGKRQLHRLVPSRSNLTFASTNEAKTNFRTIKRHLSFGLTRNTIDVVDTL